MLKGDWGVPEERETVESTAVARPAPPSRPVDWGAVLLSLLMPGAGHAYLGYWGLGAVLCVGDFLTMYGFGLFWLLTAWHAGKLSRRRKG